MKTEHKILLLTGACLWALAGCVATPDSAQVQQATAAALRTSFSERGLVKLAALEADATNRACSEAGVAGQPLDAATAQALERENFQAIQWPSDGVYLGDWKVGEGIAQSGRGLTWTDKAGLSNGGNCYNCHQIDKAEISFGTLGPSLYNYGKLRGVANPQSPASREVVAYTWGKIWNAKAYNACSNMPRFGHNGILTETQVRHLMALLLDPQSPVNR